MKISDIKKIIREELSEGDVVDFSQKQKERKEQNRIQQMLLDSIGSLAMTTFLQTEPGQAAYIQTILNSSQKQEFLNSILQWMYKRSTEPKELAPFAKSSGQKDKDNIYSSLDLFRSRLSKNNLPDLTQQLEAVEEGIVEALANLPDSGTPLALQVAKALATPKKPKPHLRLVDKEPK